MFLIATEGASSRFLRNATTLVVPVLKDTSYKIQNFSQHHKEDLLHVNSWLLLQRQYKSSSSLPILTIPKIHCLPKISFDETFKRLRQQKSHSFDESISNTSRNSGDIIISSWRIFETSL